MAAELAVETVVAAERGRRPRDTCDSLRPLRRRCGNPELALANAPRFIGHSAEETLRHACDKFALRFAAVERIAASRGLDLKQMRPEEIDALWNEAKRDLKSR